MKIKLLFFTLVLPIAMVAQTDTDSVYKPVAYPIGFTSKLNVVYTKVGVWEGKVDFYLPPNLGKATPIILNIHGGGWNHGVKESQTGFSAFFKAGYAIANMEYRLTGQATAPAAVQDARCALIYLINNAKDLNIDPNKIIVMGGSAGGHLALMAGLLANNSIFDENCTTPKKINVAAIISKYGITDVWDWAWGATTKSKSAKNWLGEKANDSLFAMSVSPINYVTPKSPPVFIVHGDADPTVPYQQSVALHKKLMEANVKTVFETVVGGLHGKFAKEKNTEINKSIISFLQNLALH